MITLCYSLSAALKNDIHYHIITLTSITMPMNCLKNNFYPQTMHKPPATRSCTTDLHLSVYLRAILN